MTIGQHRKDLTDEAVAAAYRAHGTYKDAAKALKTTAGTVRFRLERMDSREDGPRLEMPVLPSDNPTAEELLEMRKRETARVFTAAAAREWMPVKVKATGPIGVLWYGDPHIDDPGCDIAALEHDVSLVKRTPGLFGACIGDVQNNWVGRLARLYGEQQTTARQAWILVEWFVREQAGKWLCIVEGNHDLWSGSGDPLKWITRGRAVSEPDEITMRLQFPNGEQIRVAARHTWPGSSMWNPTHGQLRGGSLAVDAELVIGGHKHTGGYQMFAVPHSGAVCHAIQLGAYKLQDSYSRSQGFMNRHISPSVLTVLDPDAGPTARVQVFHDVDAGADYLTYLRSRVDA
jgi:hypothetical protein